MSGFAQKGWVKFPVEPSVLQWVRAIYSPALAAVEAPENAHWHQCEGTWFVGVDALGNDQDGRVAGSPVLWGEALKFARQAFGALPLHKAQISVVYPGYPKAKTGENEAALRYRKKRDAAHLDGLKLVVEGEKRLRLMDEYHAYILGIGLTHSTADASPMVVWEGSHEMIRQMLYKRFENVPESRWHEVDLAEDYQAVRKKIFEQCQRVEIHASPGEAYVLHRFSLHGVAPWGAQAEAPDEGRMIAYFRPEVASRADWLNKA